jgi:MFS transporter, DHA1 family, inner membrane transport protein
MVVTTVTKLVATMALRLPYVFLPTIAKGLHSSVGKLGSLLGLAELVGLATFLIGRSIDRGAFRRWLLRGIASTIVGLAIMSVATTGPIFALGFAGSTLGVALYTTTAHAWIGREVPYDRRGEVLGLFETSWAVAILFGAPVIGLVIAATSWNVPWVILAGTLIPLMFWLAHSFPANHPATVTKGDVTVSSQFRANRSVLLTLAASFTAPFGAICIFSTYGSWLEDRFNLSVRAIGILSVAIGFAELISSSGTARYSDRWGKRRSAIGGICVMGIGGIGVAIVPKVTILGIAALVTVFLGFEFGFICVLSIVSEVGGENRGAVIAANGAFMTMGRAAAAALATTIYQRFHMPAVASVTVVFAVLGVVAFAFRPGN